jgi:hypothetical protein
MRDAVTRRAGFVCEYCHLPIGAAPDPFHMDHIIARQHGGKTLLHNLALCCSRCNEHKGTNLSAIDPKTKAVAALFNPRTDTWLAHFSRVRAMIRGRTPTGRATLKLLAMNHPHRIATRLALIEEGRLAAVESETRRGKRQL